MPTKQSLFREFVLKSLRGVEHHLDDAFDVAVGGRQGRGLDPQATGNRGPDLVLVQDFAFDFAGFEHVFGQRLKDRLLAQGKTERVHAANQPSLAMPNGCELFGEAVLIPSKFGPVWQLVDVSGHNLRTFYGDYSHYSPHGQSNLRISYG